MSQNDLIALGILTPGIAYILTLCIWKRVPLSIRCWLIHLQLGDTAMVQNEKSR